MIPLRLSATNSNPFAVESLPPSKGEEPRQGDENNHMTTIPTPQPKPVAQTTESSPLPWAAIPQNPRETYWQIVTERESVQVCMGATKEDAALICQAVNSHAALAAQNRELVAFAKIALAYWTERKKLGGDIPEVLAHEARQALANSRGAR